VQLHRLTQFGRRVQKPLRLRVASAYAAVHDSERRSQPHDGDLGARNAFSDTPKTRSRFEDSRDDEAFSSDRLKVLPHGRKIAMRQLLIPWIVLRNWKGPADLG